MCLQRSGGERKSSDLGDEGAQIYGSVEELKYKVLNRIMDYINMYNPI